MKASVTRIWLFVGIAILALLWTLSLMPSPPLVGIENADKFGHLAMYGGTMWWWGQYWHTHRQRIGLAIVFTLMGVGIEYLQGRSGWRTFDVQDMIANGAGVALGWAVLYTPLGSLLARLSDTKER